MNSENISREEILEKAYQENLKVIWDSALFKDGYEVVGKHKNGNYIAKNRINVLYEINSEYENVRLI